MVAYVVAVEAAGTGLVLKGDWGGNDTDALALRRGLAALTQNALSSLAATKVVGEGIAKGQRAEGGTWRGECT